MEVNKTIRSDIQSNWLFVMVLSVPWLLGITLQLKTPQMSLAFVLLYFPVFLYFLTCFKVTINGDFLIYSVGPFQKGKVKFSEIKNVAYQKGYALNRPIYAFHISADDKSFFINIKPFSKAAISEMSKFLLTVLNRDIVDAEITQFAIGDFSKLSLTWQQRSQFLLRLAWILFFAALIRAAIKI